MAHELEMVNGKAQMAYAGNVPWHGLGTKVPEDLTPAQMMKAAGLDWSVKKAPLMFNGNQVAGDKMALYRESDNKFLDVVSKTWEPVQNEEAFDFYNEFCAAGDMEMHTAGSLKDGQKFGKGVDIRMTPIRVVCNNTLTLSINSASKNSVSLTHRKAFVKEEALQALGAAKEQFDKYKEMASFLGSKKIQNVETLIDYFNNVFPKTNKGSFEKFASRNAETAYECMETQPGAKYAEGTWWQAFNATTFMIDHQMGRSRDAALYNSWYGYNKDRKTKAANLAVEYADAV